MPQQLRLLLFITLAVICQGSVFAQQPEATLLRYAEPVEGDLAAGEREFYAFEGTEGDVVLIVMNTKRGGTDPFLRLYSPDGTLIGEDDDGNAKRNALIQGVVLPETGTYTVEALNEGSEGTYSLIINNENQIITYHGAPEIDESYLVPGRSDQLNYELSRPWPTTEITYRVYNRLEAFSEEETRQVIAQAFQAWADQTPLSFQEISEGTALINIEFGGIDGSSNVLGQACPPSSPCAGDVTFDSGERWVLLEPEFYDDISLLAVATHEFGHAIGLLHSNDPSALMYAQYSPYNLAPTEDDILGVQRLYGAGDSGGVSGAPPSAGGDDSAQAVTSQITDENYVEFWDFDVNAGEPVTIRMEALDDNLDPFLLLLDANDNVLAYDDDGGGDLNALLANVRFPETGVYTVAATRFEQVQGYSEGDYRLSIDYNPSDAPSPTTEPVATSRPGNIGAGSVRVNRIAEGDLENYTPLETALVAPFRESSTPIEQTREGTVFTEQTYAWTANWCAVDRQTLETNLAEIEVIFQLQGDTLNSDQVTRVIQDQENLSCALYFVGLSGWTEGEIELTTILRFNEPIYDGFQVYNAGDYLYNYDLVAQ
ncbi:MAG: hypothetical protein OHK0046_44890 [Anaerolineae bacterium]